MNRFASVSVASRFFLALWVNIWFSLCVWVESRLKRVMLRSFHQLVSPACSSVVSGLTADINAGYVLDFHIEDLMGGRRHVFVAHLVKLFDTVDRRAMTGVLNMFGLPMHGLFLGVCLGAARIGSASRFTQRVLAVSELVNQE